MRPLKTAEGRNFETLLAQLSRLGVLLQADATLPSVTTFIAGGPVRGSWWAHPRAHRIFTALEQLSEHRDVLTMRLIGGKVTFVHRRLWPEVLAIGTARELWQTRHLSQAARTLLRMVDKLGSLRSDRISPPGRLSQAKPGEASRELEKRLLVHAEQFHTESGAHARMIETWEHWARRAKFRPSAMSVSEAKQRLEDIMKRLEAEFSAQARLPWAADLALR